MPGGSISNYIRFARHIRISGMISSFLLSVLLFLLIYPIVLHNSTVEATAGVPTDSTTTLTMVMGSTSANLNIVPKDTPGGAFFSSSTAETAKFGIVTSNYTGYTLTISGSNNDGRLLNSDNHDIYLDSITNYADEYNFSRGSSGLYNYRWGYKPSKYNSATNEYFRPAPTTTATTLDVTNVANPVTANDYTIGLGARVNYAMPAGSYTNTFTLSTVSNPITYTINYSKGGITDTVSDIPEAQSGSVTTASSTTLSSTTPSRTGYTFAGWCLGELGDNGTSCSATTSLPGTTFNPGASFGIDLTIDNSSITLYATWTINTYTITYGTVTGIDSVSLDGTACTTALSSDGCTKTLAYGQTYNLIATPSTGYSFTSWNAGASGTIADTTSSGATTTYTVGAGASTITPTATINTYTITYGTVTGIASVTLDGGAACTTALSSGGCTKDLTYGQSYSLVGVINSGYIFNSWSATYGSIASTSSISTNYTVGTNNSTITPAVTSNIYNLAITFAGIGVSSVKVCKTSGNCSGTDLVGTVSSSGGSIANLSYNTAYYLYPVYLNTSYYDLSNWAKTSSTGTLSSTTSSNPTFTMGLGDGAVTITGKFKTTTMQGYSASLCQTNASSSPVSLTDVRDGQIYTVRYINGNCWMTRNIAIGCTGTGTTYTSTPVARTLNSTYSNVSTTWATPTTTLASGGDSNDYSYMTCSSTYGAWYNYAAATAGTIKGASNTTAASYDICPKGWKLPTLAQSQAVEGYITAFTPVAGGYYSSKAVANTERGYWWISQGGSSTTNRYRLRYINGSSLDGSSDLLARTCGFYVRCVAK